MLRAAIRKMIVQPAASKVASKGVSRAVSSREARAILAVDRAARNKAVTRKAKNRDANSLTVHTGLTRDVSEEKYYS